MIGINILGQAATYITKTGFKFHVCIYLYCTFKNSKQGWPKCWTIHKMKNKDKPHIHDKISQWIKSWREKRGIKRGFKTVRDWSTL